MIKESEVIKIGLFNKPHGVKGELSFTFTNDIFDRAEINYIICSIDGILVPFFIEEYRFRSEQRALVKLEDVDSTEQAAMFTNHDVYFPIKYMESVEQDTPLTWNMFEGFEVIDEQHGAIGTIIAVNDATINTLFVVEYQDEELLLPAQEEFIRQVDIENCQLVVALPEGLLQLDHEFDDE